MSRACSCPHGFPLCACHELPASHDALLARSRWLSSLAGWPGQLDPGAVALHEATVAAAASAPVAGPSPDCTETLLEAHRRRVDLVRACPHWSAHGCGCAQGVCSAGKGQLGTGLVGFEDCFGCLGI